MAFCRVYWYILDGVECNRQFVKLHYQDKNPVESKFVARNFYTGGPLIFGILNVLKSKYFLNLNPGCLSH